MKKVCTYLIAAALTGTALTASVSAAPAAITVYQASGPQLVSEYQFLSCGLTLPESLSDLLANCPDVVLPGQFPSLPGGNVTFPGGGTTLPDQNPSLPGGENKPSTGDEALSSYEAEVVRLVNEARRENGLQPLAASGALSRVARAKSQDMVDQRYFDHNSPTYGTPFQMLTSFGISYRTAGENIAYGQRTPQEVVSGWLNSPGHRANILNASYTQIGVGYVANGNYWTQLFIG